MTFYHIFYSRSLSLSALLRRLPGSFLMSGNPRGNLLRHIFRYIYLYSEQHLDKPDHKQQHQDRDHTGCHQHHSDRFNKMIQKRFAFFQKPRHAVFNLLQSLLDNIPIGICAFTYFIRYVLCFLDRCFHAHIVRIFYY